MFLEPRLSTDTPFKPATTVGLTHEKMHMGDVQAGVKRDIKNTLYTVKTDEFLERIIPTIPTLQDSLDQLTKNGTYTGSHWTDYPKKDQSHRRNEKSIYKPFADIMNAIVRSMPKEDIRTDIVYVDRHKTSPKSLEADMADGRPDGAGAQPDAKITELEDKIKKQKGLKVHYTRAQARDAREEELSIERKEKILELYKLWWMCIHIVYEIKWDQAEEDRLDAVKQLLGYMRLLLAEQLDRRFVLGFILLYDDLTLVLCDRSGMMMTSASINIHRDWNQFVRIVTGFSYMSPTQLGWDPAMKIYVPLTKDIKPSYLISHDLRGIYGSGRYNIHWVIDIEKDEKVEKYISVAIISALRSAEICGRATIVYEVVKFDEKENPKKTYALKRYWKPIQPDATNLQSYPCEGQIYDILDKEQADEEMKHTLVYHDIKIGTKIDSTLDLIRCGVVAQLYEYSATQHLPVHIRAESDADAEPRLDRRDLVQEYALESPLTHVTVYRCHMNLLMPMGRELRSFCSLLELLYCYQDYLEELWNGNKKGIIHRDISIGNLLIFDHDHQRSRNFGRLIDYDHAKKASGMGEIQSMIAGLSPEKLDAKRGLLQSLIKDKFGGTATDDVLDTALKWLDPADAFKYIQDAIQFLELSDHVSKNSLSIADLGWYNIQDKTQSLNWPNFADHVAHLEERTGTLPYMSGEVIARRFLHVHSASPFIHEAIHDVESLFWVLIRLCLTRKGPGLNMRREELDKTSSNLQLRDLISCLFDGNEVKLKKMKMDLHAQANLFKDQVIIHFHDFFKCLEPYVLRWWNTLILGYRYKAEEYYNIHHHILDIIKEAINDIEIRAENEKAKQEEQEELERRKEHKEKLLATFRMPSISPGLSKSLMKRQSSRYDQNSLSSTYKRQKM
ncbi:hypothetical protein C0992_000685 [Termitomyces sp. T32_za158]|nr:hypothetical protein C0992_000685 [Termitomyces sp. T32_za158]